MILKLAIGFATFGNPHQTRQKKWEGELALYKFAAEKLS